MRVGKSIIVTVMASSAFTCVLAAPKVATKTVHVKEATIVAFAPSLLIGSDAQGAQEAVAHLRFAVDDTYKCLHPKKVRVILLYADRLLLRNGAASETIEVHKLGQAVGATIVEPGRRSQTVHSVDGPSNLQHLLPQAAYEYWQVPPCKQ